ncbi:MAG TPA: hypothetical protein ENK33_09590 [Desulfobacterales bacterium]|nr:hypothetical protein [Desulfobacterales bacterium]
MIPLRLRYLALALLLPAATARAAWRQFVPTIWYSTSGLSYDYRFISHTSKDKSQDRETLSRNKEVRATLDFSSLGYIYNPDLLIFTLDFAGETDRNTHTNEQDDGWQVNKGDGIDFDLAGLVLRRKHLNLDFHISESRPFITSVYGDSNTHETIFQGDSALNYRLTPLSARLGYSHYKSTTEDNSGIGGTAKRWATNDTVNISSSYKGKGYSVNGAASHRIQKNETDQKPLSSLTGNNSSANNFLRLSGTLTYKNFDFLSSGNYSVSHTDNDLVSGETLPSNISAHKSFIQNIKIHLPWNMSSKIEMSVDRQDDSNRDLDQTRDWLSTYDENEYLNAKLNHRLYESLFTQLKIGWRNKNSESDRTKTQDYNLSIDYRKRLFGGYLTARTSNDLLITGQQGTPSYTDVIPGNFTSAGPFPITFNIKPNADPPTITVAVCDINHSDTNTGGKHYSCDCYAQNSCTKDIDNTLWQNLSQGSWNANTPIINITALPATGGPYEIRANYSLPAGEDYTISSNTTRFSVNLSLLDNRLSSTYEYSLTKEKFLKGNSGFEDLQPQVTRDYVNLIWTEKPFKIENAYTWLEGTNFYDRRWHIETSYNDGRKITNYLYSGWWIIYKRDDTHGEDASAESKHDVEWHFNTGISFSGPVPLTGIHYNLTTSLVSRRGNAPEYQFNDKGLWQNIDYEKDDTDTYSNALKLYGVIPYIKCTASVQGRYILSKNLTNGINTKSLYYIFNAERNWIFGATTISLNGNYSINDQRGEVGATDQVNRRVDTNSKIFLKIRRILF